MRETSQQREIVVPTDMRGGRVASKSGRARPSRGGAPGGEFAAALRAVGGWLAGRFLANPAGAAGFVVVCCAATYITLNALGFQDGRHPAPILPQPKSEAVAAVEPASRKVAAKPSGETSVASQGAAALSREPPRAPGRDAIGDMIRGAEETTASVGTKADRPRVEAPIARAQRALTKLGYGPLKDDGVMGPSTRTAIEKFERDHKLPVKGEASGRTLRELATRAGMPPG